MYSVWKLNCKRELEGISSSQENNNNIEYGKGEEVSADILPLINIDKTLSSINDIDPPYGGFDKKRDNRAVT